MAFPEQPGFTVFRNETFLNFGVVAVTRTAEREHRDYVHELDVYAGALDHARTSHFYFPLMRTDGAPTQFGWDPIVEDERTPEGEMLTGLFELPDSLKKYKEDFPGRLWMGMVAYEAGMLDEHTQVITDFDGGALPPLVTGFKDGGVMEHADRHDITPWFVGTSLGRVRLNQEEDTLNIDRTCTRLSEDGTVIILESEVVAKDLPNHESAEGEHLAVWQPAIKAVYERLYCEPAYQCTTAHYGMKAPRKAKGRSGRGRR